MIIPRFSWCQQIVVQRVSSAPTRRKAQTPADARPVLWSTRILHRKRHKEKTKLCGVADPCLPLRKPRRRVARARTSPRDVVREPFISTHHYSCVCQQRSMSQALSSVPVNTASFIATEIDADIRYSHYPSKTMLLQQLSLTHQSRDAKTFGESARGRCSRKKIYLISAMCASL